MIGYAAEEVFSRDYINIWRRTTKLIHGLEEKEKGRWRCHEIARAVERFMALPNTARVVDGECGLVEHSWIELDRDTILDTYTVGRMPMVQLIHVSVASLIRTPFGPVQFYVEDPVPREDIRWDEVDIIKNRIAQIVARSILR